MLERPRQPGHAARRLSLAWACAWAASVLACGGRSTLEPGQLLLGEQPEPAATPSAEPPAATDNPLKPDEPRPPQQPDAPDLPGAGGAPAMEEPPFDPEHPNCQSFTLPIGDLRPQVTLLVDQSGSMRAGYPERESPQTRWTLVRDALLDPERGVVPKLQQSIRFGLVFYTSRNGFSAGTCPILTSVRSATNNYQAIRKLYDSTWPDDDTPTGEAIGAVVRHLQAEGRRGPNVILLVTDGDPDTCSQPDPQDGQVQALSGAAAAFNAGVDFYVLGISSDISGDKLQQLANAGKGRPLGAVFGRDAEAAEPYQASGSIEGLSAQLSDILAQVPLCQVELERDADLADLGTSQIELDGKPLRPGQDDGFELRDPRHLEITGEACEKLRASGKRLSVRIACD